MTGADLRDDERWAAALSGASMTAPSLVDAMALMVPFRSDGERYASIDRSWRVAVGPGFFTLNRPQTDFLIIHLCMHRLCMHFERADARGLPMDRETMLAMDAEIDHQIMLMDGVELIDGYQTPESLGLTPGRTMEEYYDMIHQAAEDDEEDGDGPEDDDAPGGGAGEDGDGEDDEDDGAGGMEGMPGDDDGSAPASDAAGAQTPRAADDGGEESPEDDGAPTSGPDAGDGTPDGGRPDDGDGLEAPGGPAGGDGDGSPDGDADGDADGGDTPDTAVERTPDDVSMEADMDGVEQPTPSEIIDSMKEVRRMAGESSSGYGSGGSGDDPISMLIVSHSRPPKTNWRDVLSRVTANARMRKSYQSVERTYSKINTRAAAFFPDIIIPGMTSYQPKIVMALDTSGSMGSDRIMTALTEAQGILKAGSGSTDFSVFCVDTEAKDMQPVDDISKLDVTGGGGTDMAPAFKYIRSLPQYDRPDVFVLATDGYVPWRRCMGLMPDWGCTVIILIVDKGGMKQVPEWLDSAAHVIDVSD